DVAGRLGGEDLDRVLVADVVRALDGVVGVDLRRVVLRVPERGVDAALSRAGMAPGRVELRDHRNIRACIVRGDGRAHACAAGAHYEDVVLTNHCKRTLPNLGDSPEVDRGAGRGQVRVVEPLEVLPEHRRELARLHVVGRRVAPGRAWVEQLRVDPRDGERHLEAEDLVEAELRALELAGK